MLIHLLLSFDTLWERMRVAVCEWIPFKKKNAVCVFITCFRVHVYEVIGWRDSGYCSTCVDAIISWLESCAAYIFIQQQRTTIRILCCAVTRNSSSVLGPFEYGIAHMQKGSYLWNSPRVYDDSTILCWTGPLRRPRCISQCLFGGSTVTILDENVYSCRLIL